MQRINVSSDEQDDAAIALKGRIKEVTMQINPSIQGWRRKAGR